MLDVAHGGLICFQNTKCLWYIELYLRYVDKNSVLTQSIFFIQLIEMLYLIIQQEVFSPMRNTLLLILVLAVFGISQAQDKTLPKKKHWVRSVSYSQDGHLLASGGDGGEVVIWDAEKAAVLHELQGHQNIVLALAFSPDGYYVASGGLDGAVKVWRVDNGLLEKNFLGHTAAVTSLVFSPDGRYLYSGGADKVIGVWDMDRNMKASELRGHEDAISGLAISPDGETLVSSSYDRHIKIWNTKTNSSDKSIDLRGKRVRTVDFSADGKYLAAGTDDGIIRVVDMETHTIGLFMRAHSEPVYSLKFSKDGQYIASAGLDGNVKLWSAETGLLEKVYPRLVEPSSLSFNPQGTWLALGATGPEVILFDMKPFDIKPGKIRHFRPAQPVVAAAPKPVETAAPKPKAPTPVAAAPVTPTPAPAVDYTHPVKTKVVFNKEKPVIDVVQPLVDPSKEFLLFLEKEIVVKGSVKSKNGIFELIINGQEVPVTYDKSEKEVEVALFEHTVKLAYGNNTVKIKAVDVFNNVEEKSFVIQRQIKVASLNDTIGRMGRDYALIIATDDYDSWGDLRNPVNDGTTIAKELETTYGFQTEIIKNPTRTELYGILRAYNKKAFADDDQLFIFIAGHGEFDEVFSEGYLVTKDSKSNDEIKESYVSHSNLRTIINNIPCNHILLTMDVCFGGTFDPFVANSRGVERTGGYTGDDAKRLFIERKMKFDTRKFLTSGGKEYVPDGRPGYHSPFAAKLLEGLRGGGGDDGIITFGELFNFVERANPAPTQGSFGKNQPGSDFLFIKK